MYLVSFIIYINRNYSLNSYHDLKWNGLNDITVISYLRTEPYDIPASSAILSLSRHPAGRNTSTNVLPPEKNIRQNSYQPSTIDQTPIVNTTSHVHNENIPFLHPIYLNRDTSARRMYTHTYILYQHTPYNNPTSGQHRYISLLNYSPPVHPICTVPHIPFRRAFLFSP